MSKGLPPGEQGAAQSRLVVRLSLLATFLVVACLAVIAIQLVVAFRGERSAVARLKSKGDARFSTANKSLRDEDGLTWDWSELRNGRVFTPVDSVMLDDAFLDQESADAIASLAHLSYLSLQNCELATDQPLLSRLPRLEILELTQASLLPRELQEIPKLGQLRCLSLRGAPGQNNPTMDCVTANPHLEELDLHGLHLSDRAIQQIGAMAQLRWLGLTGCNFAPEALLGVGGQLKQIRTLQLRSTCVDDRLFQQHAFPNLVSLNLSNCNITDGGVRAITGNRSLIDVTLRNTRITDAGVHHLTTLPKLVAVDLKGTQATSASQETLKAIPTLEWKFVLLP